MYRIASCAAVLLLLCSVNMPAAAGGDGYESINRNRSDNDNRNRRPDTTERNRRPDTTDRNGYETQNQSGGRTRTDRTDRNNGGSGGMSGRDDDPPNSDEPDDDTPDRNGAPDRNGTTTNLVVETQNKGGGTRLDKGGDRPNTTDTTDTTNTSNHDDAPDHAPTVTTDTRDQPDAGDAAACGKASGEEAIAACTRVLQRTPNDAVAHSNRGMAYSAKGDNDHAITDFDEAIKLNPKFTEAYYRRGLARSGNGDYEHADTDFDQAIKLGDEAIAREPDAAAYRNRGNAYMAKRDYDHAIVDYDQAIRLNAKDPGAYNLRGLAYWKKHNFDRALADFDEVLKLDPKNAGAYNNRGVVYNDKGDFDRAIAELDHAIQLNPNMANPYSHRGYAYGRKGDFTRAIDDLNKAINLDPKYARGWSNRAAIYELHGDTARAVSDADQALRLDRRDAFAHNVHGKVDLDRGQFALAIADYDLALQFDPNLGEARENREHARVAMQPPDKDKGSDKDKDKGNDKGKGNVTPPISGPPQRRVALVIGNSAYRNAPALPNPKRDAEAVAAALRVAGFQTVDLATDVSRDNMNKALKAFRAHADSADWAVVYYAGHGIEVDGRNYLIPVDAQLDDLRDVAGETISYDQVLDTISHAHLLRLLVLDACRVNPFGDRLQTASRGPGSRGLAAPPENPGTLTVYAAAKGTVAADDVDGDGNSPFARAFLAQLKVPGREVRKLFDYVRDDVYRATGGRQMPFYYGTMPSEPDFFFVLPTAK